VETIIKAFSYPDAATEEFCQKKLARIHALKQRTIRNLSAIGRELEEVKARLPHGQFTPWLEAFWSGSMETARRCRLLSCAIEQIPQIGEFRSVTAAAAFVELEPWQQEAVLERQAFTWGEYRRAVWDATARRHLAGHPDDKPIPWERRCGDVLHAIEEALGDPALEPVARTLYQENREAFARLSAREPAEVDVEVGAKKTDLPAGNQPSAQLVEAERYWICEWDGEGWRAVAPVSAYILAWFGAEPSLLAAFPAASDGPAATAWRASAVDAVCRRLNATTMATVYGEVL